jgi:hypothetical protein
VNEENCSYLHFILNVERAVPGNFCWCLKGLMILTLEVDDG